MARSFIHPSAKDFTIDGVLYALSDPVRRKIVAKLLGCNQLAMSCNKACEELSPSTISFHYKVLRETGLIASKKVGVEVMNSVRIAEMDKRFPGLIESILKHER